MYSFEAVNRTKVPEFVNYSEILVSKWLKLEEVSICSQVKNTRGGGVLFFYKTCILVIFEYSNTFVAEYLNPLFSTNPSPTMDCEMARMALILAFIITVIISNSIIIIRV